MTSLMDIEFFGNDFLIEKPTSEKEDTIFSSKAFVLCVCVCLCAFYINISKEEKGSIV